MRAAFGLLVLAAAIAGTQAHICLIQPAQRGGVNVSTPGNMACFHPNAPCGSSPSATPTVVLQGGQAFDFLFQQNLNHYNPGFPGFLDVAWTTFPEPKGTDSGFQTLAYIPDYWAHLQAMRTNFSVPTVVPNIDCDHCVIRVRYHPNKPTEPIFHNCADVKIVSTPVPAAADHGRVFAVTGATSVPQFFQDSVVEVLPFGNFSNIDMPSGPQFFFPEGMVTALTETQTVYWLAETANNFVQDTPASILVSYDAVKGTWSNVSTSIPAGVHSQWDAIVPSAHKDYPLMVVGRVQNGTAGFSYQIRGLNFDGTVSDPLAQTQDQQTFVNFFWADTDPIRGMLYFLAGDENSLEILDALLYSVDVMTGQVTTVMQDTSAYTLSNLHVNPVDGLLYAVSPGLFNSGHAYTLVRVDPTTGSVTAVGQTAPAGMFDFYYGGGVYGPSVTPSNTLFHMFKSLDGAFSLAEIDLATGAMVRAPALVTGVNGMLDLKSPVYVPPQ